MFKEILILFWFIYSVEITNGSRFRRVCYYYRQDQLNASKIDVDLCTDLIYYRVSYTNGSMSLPKEDKDGVQLQQLKKLQKVSSFRLLMGHGYSGIDPGIGGSKVICRFFMSYFF